MAPGCFDSLLFNVSNLLLLVVGQYWISSHSIIIAYQLRLIIELASCVLYQDI